MYCIAHVTYIRTITVYRMLIFILVVFIIFSIHLLFHSFQYLLIIVSIFLDLGYLCAATISLCAAVLPYVTYQIF